MRKRPCLGGDPKPEGERNVNIFKWMCWGRESPMLPNCDLGNYVDNDFPLTRTGKMWDGHFGKKDWQLRLGHSELQVAIPHLGGDFQQTLGYVVLELRREVWARGRDHRRVWVWVWVDSLDIHERSPRENVQWEENTGWYLECCNRHKFSKHLQE